ncbi:MAG: DUF4232 domain-containing protein [Solirubrobacterales bacterium]|nr:DUF4232 domain-containing protein [Solirubrobacterales bacterium]
MLSIRRTLAGTLAAGAVLAAAVSPAPADAAAPACTSNQLVVWLNTQPNGAAGTIYYTLSFTNAGAACTLRGYPGLAAVGSRGRRLGSAANRNPTHKVTTVTLGAADPTRDRFSSALATVGITEVGDFSTSTCRPATALGMRVFAPGQAAAQFVPFPFAACAASGPIYLRVSPVTR